MIVTLRPLTYDDLREMPDDGFRYEIINGELIESPAPPAGHQRALLRLYRLCEDHVRQTRAGELFFAPFDVRLGRFDVVQPDLVFISSAHPRVPDAENSVDYAPELVVEVVSPLSRRTDRVRKMALYARSGVSEYWVVDPGWRTLFIHVLDGEEYIFVEPDANGWLASRVLPGLRVDPAEVFSALD